MARRFAALAIALAATGALFAQAPHPGAAADAAIDPSRFNQDCGVCHAIDVVTSQSHSAEEWRAVVQRMVEQNGAELPPAEQDAIVLYLARSYGPPASSPSQH